MTCFVHGLANQRWSLANWLVIEIPKTIRNNYPFVVEANIKQLQTQRELIYTHTHKACRVQIANAERENQTFPNLMEHCVITPSLKNYFIIEFVVFLSLYFNLTSSSSQRKRIGASIQFNPIQFVIDIWNYLSQWTVCEKRAWILLKTMSVIKTIYEPILFAILFVRFFFSSLISIAFNFHTGFNVRCSNEQCTCVSVCMKIYFAKIKR